MELVISGHVV